jgi:hypothetical protein
MTAFSYNRIWRRWTCVVILSWSFFALFTDISQTQAAAPARAKPYAESICNTDTNILFCEDFEGQDIINYGNNNCGSVWGNPALDNGPYGGAPATFCWGGGGSYQYSSIPLSGFNQSTNHVWRVTKTQSFTDVVTGKNTGTGNGTITGYFKSGLTTGVKDFYVRFQAYWSPDHTWPSQYDFKTVFVLPRNFVDPPSAPYETGIFLTHGYWCGPSYFSPSGQNFPDVPQIRYSSAYHGMPYQNEYCPPRALGQPANGTNAPRLEKNRWYTLQYHVKLASDNTGVLELWVDGNRAYRELRITCDSGCPDIGNVLIMGWMNSADAQTGYYEIDNVVISKAYIPPPNGVVASGSVPNPPTTLNVK